MKKIILFSVFSFYTCFLMQGQEVIYSPNNLELSFGTEGFYTFIPRLSNFSNFGTFGGSFSSQEPEKGNFRLRPVISVSYRKMLDSGNYFSLLGTFGKSSWLKENIEVSTFDVFGEETIITISEEKEEGTIGLGYIYSFLVSQKNPNWQFFIGGEGSIYNNFATNIPREPEAGGQLNRNIFGLRISAVPELIYSFPNSPVTLSLRAKLPVIHFEHNQENKRMLSFNSFFTSFTHNSARFLAVPRTRLELGIGYFLEAE